MTNIQELLSKPVWQMTGEEFIFLSKHASGQAEALPQPVTDTEKKYVYGILGIAKLFGCSLPTANRIKKSGKIDKAITQIGRKIIVDAELARNWLLNLPGRKQEDGNNGRYAYGLYERNKGNICRTGNNPLASFTPEPVENLRKST